MGLQDPRLAFQFDEACLMAGRQLEKELIDGGPATVPGKYSAPDPNRIVKRKMDARGLW